MRMWQRSRSLRLRLIEGNQLAVMCFELEDTVNGWIDDFDDC